MFVCLHFNFILWVKRLSWEDTCASGMEITMAASSVILATTPAALTLPSVFPVSQVFNREAVFPLSCQFHCCMTLTFLSSLSQPPPRPWFKSSHLLPGFPASPFPVHPVTTFSFIYSLNINYWVHATHQIVLDERGNRMMSLPFFQSTTGICPELP